MTIEALLWGVIPTAIGIASIAVSIGCAVKRRKKSQMFGAAIVVLFTLFSFWLLKKIFIDGDWPTFLPHFLIAAAAVVSVIQMRSVRAKKTEPNLEGST